MEVEIKLRLPDAASPPSSHPASAARTQRNLFFDAAARTLVAATTTLLVRLYGVDDRAPSRVVLALKRRPRIDAPTPRPPPATRWHLPLPRARVLRHHPHDQLERPLELGRRRQGVRVAKQQGVHGEGGDSGRATAAGARGGVIDTLLQGVSVCDAGLLDLDHCLLQGTKPPKTNRGS